MQMKKFKCLMRGCIHWKNGCRKEYVELSSGNENGCRFFESKRSLQK